jgi:hypothetical protein
MRITIESGNDLISREIPGGEGTTWMEISDVFFQMLNGLSYVIRDPEACSAAAQEENRKWKCGREE